MYEKHYVIQWRVNEWDKWTNLAGEYATPDAAKKVMEQKRKTALPFTKYRVAEAYIVVRYKPVKE